jgi:hypothetical protein
MLMTRAAMMIAVVMMAASGLSGAAQETIKPAPVSPVHGGKVIKPKTLTAEGTVKSVAADSLSISDAQNRDWTFAVDARTKIVLKNESVDVTPTSPVQGGKKMPSTPGAGQEKIDVAPTSPIQGGQVMPSTTPTAADLKEGQHVQVTYHSVDGKMHATRVKVM